MCFSSSDFCQVDFYFTLLKGKINFIDNDIYSCKLFVIISLILKNNKLSRPNINQLLNNSIISNHIYIPMKYLNVLHGLLIEFLLLKIWIFKKLF